MARKKITGKPGDMIRKRWQREHEGVVRFLEELDEALKTDPDDPWAAKMKAHYLDRLKHLNNILGDSANRVQQ